MFHGLGYKAVRILAYKYATRLGRNVPDSWNRGKISGRDWMSGFMSRHKNIYLRSPEATSIARAHGFNKKYSGSMLWLFACTQILRNTNLKPMWFIILMNLELPQYKVSPKSLLKRVQIRWDKLWLNSVDSIASSIFIICGVVC